MYDFDLPVIQHAMATAAKPVATAGLFPPDWVVQKFSAYFPPETPFSFILRRLCNISQLHPHFHLCILDAQIAVADEIQNVKGLSISDRLTFCASPVNLRNEGAPAVLVAFARCVAERAEGHLLRFPELRLEILDEVSPADGQYLSRLENLHKDLVLYLWLSYRFSSIFLSRALAFHVAELLQEKINGVLVASSQQASLRRGGMLLGQSSQISDNTLQPLAT